MSLSQTDNYLHTLIGQGNDAHTNIYLVHFGLKTPGKNAEYATVRCEGFTPPTPSQDSYTVRYLNVSIDRPRAKVKIDKFFDLVFRVDGNYIAYKMLKNLQQQTFSENPDENITDISLNKGTRSEEYNLTVSVEVPGIGTLFGYERCWIESVTPIAFKQGTSDPVKVTVRVNYLIYKDYQEAAATEYSDLVTSGSESSDSTATSTGGAAGGAATSDLTPGTKPNLPPLPNSIPFAK